MINFENKKVPKNKIIPQMFDVRPVDETGDLDWKKIQAVDGGFTGQAQTESISEERNTAKAYILGVPVESESAPVFHDPNFNIDDYFNKLRKENETDYAFLELEKEIEKRKLQQQQRLEGQIEKQRQIAMEAGKRKIELEKIAQLRRAEKEERELEFKAERERKEQERLLQLEIEKREIQKQKEILEKLQRENREKELLIASEKARLQIERGETIKREAQERKLELRKITELNRAQQLSYEEAVIAERKQRQLEFEKWLEEETKEKAKLEKLKSKKKSGPVWWFSEKQKAKRRGRGKDQENLFSWQNIFGASQPSFQFEGKSGLAMFAIVAVILSFGIGGISYASKGIGLKGRVLGVSQNGFENLTSAVDEMANQNFEGSAIQFSKALENFSKGSSDLESLGGDLLDVTRFLPFTSVVSSGKNAVEAGKHFSAAGQHLNEVVKISASLKNPLESKQVSLIDVLGNAEKNISLAKIELDAAQKNIDHISIDDLPEDKRDKFLLLKQKMPELLSSIDLFLDNNHILVELLGGNGPRKYLFLFQNNTEMRATGGFIGSYGLMDISNGHVKKFFIDGIFNPDGQLKDRIVPPQPIQKISVNWSMHDSNWFADFPSSAKKAIYFYERTGGPTADGVITLTPTVLQKFLKITGPIEMPDYDVTLDSENFVELTQYEVEVDYDKEENEPKKILSDLAPMVMEKLLQKKDLESISKTMDALLEGLEEKHILLYSQNDELQKIISKQGWSGEILSAANDYVSVINSNINGYKTDAVIEEKISHNAEIQKDGSIVDTLAITRKHNGGSSEYEWLNKVNADYMRAYVPAGSKLLEVSGHTRETYEAPVDYENLGFRKDSDVENQENKISIDEGSGTRIYSESDKTVFANWVYVSPGESVTITYKYTLPFSLFNVSVGKGNQVDSYSLVAQKQSGSLGSEFESALSFPEDYELKWNMPVDGEINGNKIEMKNKLNEDRFVGAVFEKRD